MKRIQSTRALKSFLFSVNSLKGLFKWVEIKIALVTCLNSNTVNLAEASKICLFVCFFFPLLLLCTVAIFKRVPNVPTFFFSLWLSTLYFFDLTCAWWWQHDFRRRFFFLQFGIRNCLFNVWLKPGHAQRYYHSIVNGIEPRSIAKL